MTILVFNTLIFQYKEKGNGKTHLLTITTYNNNVECFGLYCKHFMHISSFNVIETPRNIYVITIFTLYKKMVAWGYNVTVPNTRFPTVRIRTQIQHVILNSYNTWKKHTLGMTHTKLFSSYNNSIKQLVILSDRWSN